jgi:predicted O-methyltransferase YrrM
VTNFIGTTYRTANNWFDIIALSDYENIPINYLEIGAFYGANLLSVADTYCKHIDSKLYAIDPWEDYEEYPEYKNEQSQIYNSFITNIENSQHNNKISINRGFSNEKIPKLIDNFFDIIYIDGNHNPDYVIEDAVLSFRKLKSRGIIIFDDYGWGGPDMTTRGIEAFINAYHKKIEVLGSKESQVFIKKR